MLNTSNMLPRVIVEGIEKMIFDHVNQEIEKIKTGLHDKVPEIVAAVSLKAMSSVSYEKYGTDLVIKVKMEHK